MSWVIRERATKRVIFETFNQNLIPALRPEYEGVPIIEYLQELNNAIAHPDNSANHTKCVRCGRARSSHDMLSLECPAISPGYFQAPVNSGCSTDEA